MRKKYRLKGWVRRTLSILLVVVLTTAVLPDMGSVFVRADGAVVYTQASAPTVDEANKIIYGNGTPLLVTYREQFAGVSQDGTVRMNYYTSVYIYENQVKGTLVYEKYKSDSSDALGGLSGWTIVGGYADGTYAGDIAIRVDTYNIKERIDIYGTYQQNVIGNITLTLRGSGNNNNSYVRIHTCDSQDFIQGNVAVTGQNANTSANEYISNIDITGTVTGNTNVDCNYFYINSFSSDLLTTQKLSVKFTNCDINQFSVSDITADDVNITAELTRLTSYKGVNGNISGNVTTQLTTCSVYDVLYGVSGNVGGNVQFDFSNVYSYYLTESDSNVMLCRAQVEGDLTANINACEFKTALNIGSWEPLGTGTVKGNVEVNISGLNEIKSVSCWINDTKQSTLQYSGNPWKQTRLYMNGFTDRRVHVVSPGINELNKIYLVYPASDCIDGKVVAEADSFDLLNLNNYIVIDENDKEYDLIKVDNQILILNTSQNTITATATGNGSISPSGAVSYAKGASAVYTITPAQGYAIADVLVDGRSVGVTERYTFDNIFADHTIEARFEEISVNGMELIHEPSRIEYQEGDTMDFTGMKVKLSYTDGTSYECPYEEFEQYGITTDYDGQPLTESMNLTQFKITYGTYLAYTEPISVTARTQNIDITMNPFDFGKQEEGYVSNGGSGDEYIEISNTGNDTVEIDITMPDGMDYFVIEKDKLTLAPGAGGKIYVRPKQGLTAGTYTGTLKVGTPSGTLKETTLQFTVKPDVTLPTGSINVSGDKWSGILNQITFGKFFNKTQKVLLSASDSGSGVGSIHYMIADRSYSMDELNALPNGKWTLYEKEFNIEPDRQYIIYAKITDKAGNAIYVSSDGMILDATLPKFGGVEQNGKYYDTSENFNKKFTVQDENLDYVTINGERVFPENGEYTLYPKDDIQEITAVDKAGNVSVVQVTVGIGQPSVLPVITGIEDGGVYCEFVRFTVEDDNLDKVFAGDIELIPEDGVYTVNGNGQPVKITAQDVDDNRTEMMIQVNPQHTWKTGGVEKAPTCTETGSANAVCEVCGEHGQTELLPLGHDFSQDWTIDVEPTGKTAGEKSHHCSRCDGRRDVMKIPATGVGMVKVMLVTGEGVPEMSVANSQESLIKNVLTQKETDMLAQGYDIYLTVTVSPKEDVSELQQEQTAGWILKRPENGGIVGYYDISMTKQTGDDGEKIPVTQTVAKLILKAGRPDESGMTDGTTREYQMLIFNGGDIQELVTVREDDGKIRFATDQTGTIVLVYHDTAVTPDNPSDKPGNTPPDNPTDTLGNPLSDDPSDNPGNDHGDSDSGDSKNKGTTPVQTGDSTPVTWLFALLALSGTGIVGSKAKKKSKVTE